MISPERIKELLDYNPFTGVFSWRRHRWKRMIGTVAGWDDGSGYVQLAIDGKQYRAHRLAFLWMTGEMPNVHVDHEDGNRANNRWRNLRIATPSQNHANTPLRADNKSGFKGVCFLKTLKKFRAAIEVSGKTIHLGVFKTPEEAHSAYMRAAEKHFKEFAHAG